jgi:hypothetical protein
MKTIGLCFLLGLTSCAAEKCPVAGITKEVCDAGGGNPRYVSNQAMQAWFGRHQPFGRHIAEECVKIRSVHDWIGYLDSPEGRVCAAAQITQVSRAGRDGKTF